MVFDIGAIGAIATQGGAGISGGAGATQAGGGSFGDMFSKLIENASGAESKSDDLVKALAKGEPTDVHSVMVALTEAELAFRTVLEVRNRLVEAYQEIQRMPI